MREPRHAASVQVLAVLTALMLALIGAALAALVVDGLVFAAGAVAGWSFPIAAAGLFVCGFIAGFSAGGVVGREIERMRSDGR